MNRPLAPLFLLVFLTFSACTSTPSQFSTPKLEQKGVLKVHPGLLGLPVPSELRDAEPAAEKKTADPATPLPALAVPQQPKEGAPRNEDMPASTPASLYFDLNAATIKPEHLPLLTEHAQRLASQRSARLRIEGNADERGPDGYNKQLGMKRAQAVQKVLVAKGARSSQIRLVSYGKSRPKVNGQDEASWAENRRADLIYER